MRLIGLREKARPRQGCCRVKRMEQDTQARSLSAIQAPLFIGRVCPVPGYREAAQEKRLLKRPCGALAVHRVQQAGDSQQQKNSR